MITITDFLKIDGYEQYLGGFDRNDVLFFDIETTGFSAETTVLYMLGIIYHEENRPVCTQYFAESEEDEPVILRAFFEKINLCKCVVSYNGDGFDIPYLLKKCHKYNIACNFDNVCSLDIYKAISPWKNILKLENLKQKTIENFLQTDRKDKFTGGMLIEYYFKYRENASKDIFDMLVLHNKEDLIGLTEILPMLSYPAIIDSNPVLTEISSDKVIPQNQGSLGELSMTFRLSSPVPQKIDLGNDNFFITADASCLTLRIKTFCGELKYFYPNYKDYFYLPNEDTAIHKSVAQYVDKRFRTKAKASNCYSKKAGVFLPQYDEIMTPCFKKDYNDKISYFEFSEDFINDNELINKYLHNIFNHLLGLRFVIEERS